MTKKLTPSRREGITAFSEPPKGVSFLEGNMNNAAQWRKENPWYCSYSNAKFRCSKNGSYFKRGIRFNMTVEEFKFLWFRDKAFNLKRPSIDRIDSAKDYTLKNCRYIELSDNVAWSRGKETTPIHKHACKKGWIKRKNGFRYGRPFNQLDINGNIIHRWQSLKEAADYYGVTINQIYYRLVGLTKDKLGHRWEYIPDTARHHYGNGGLNAA